VSTPKVTTEQLAENIAAKREARASVALDGETYCVDPTPAFQGRPDHATARISELEAERDEALSLLRDVLNNTLPIRSPGARGIWAAACAFLAGHPQAKP
jgi:hypothetical protein